MSNDLYKQAIEDIERVSSYEEVQLILDKLRVDCELLHAEIAKSYGEWCKERGQFP